MWAYAVIGIAIALGLAALVRGWYKAGKSTQEARSAQQTDKDVEKARRARHRYRTDSKYAERVRKLFTRK